MAISRMSEIVSKRKKFLVRIRRTCDWFRKHRIKHMDSTVTKAVQTALGHGTPKRLILVLTLQKHNKIYLPMLIFHDAHKMTSKISLCIKSRKTILQRTVTKG